MRRLRIICDTDKHTSEIIDAISAFKPQYLIFAEEELDVKHRIDTLPRAGEMPAGLEYHTEKKAPELKALPEQSKRKKHMFNAAKHYHHKKKEHNAKLPFRPDPGGRLAFEDDGRGHQKIDIDATLKSFGITAKQLEVWMTDEGSDLARLKAAVRMAQRR